MTNQSRLWGPVVGSIDVTIKEIDDKPTYGKDVMHSCFFFKGNNQCYFVSNSPGPCDGCFNWICFDKAVIRRLNFHKRHIDYYDLLDVHRKVLGNRKPKLMNDTTTQKTL